MPSLTLTDMASRTGAMAEAKRKRNWIKTADRSNESGTKKVVRADEGLAERNAHGRREEKLKSMTHKRMKSPLYVK